jgi:Domain of unknown function (DUF4372)
MRHQNSLMHELLQFIPWGRFERLVDDHGADRRVRRLDSKSQLVALLHAQLSGAASLREIEATMASHRARLYHLGVTAPKRSPTPTRRGPRASLRSCSRRCSARPTAACARRPKRRSG